eukprot:362103-Chlamydomonas_euryale.AAC.4
MVVDLQRKAFAGAARRGIERSTAGNGGALRRCQVPKCPSAQVPQGRSPPAPLPPRSPPITIYHDAGVTPTDRATDGVPGAAFAALPRHAKNWTN